jgi:OOP family OmpA-OmpF porin
VSGRFDFRDNLSQKGKGADNGKQTHHPELHLGVTFTFERTPPPLPVDRDYDGLYDQEDQCPDQGALTVDGCPTDSDGDGVLDPVDECPAVPGAEPTGCPNLDEDGDGVPIPVDQCPDQMASTPDGCPDQDLDGDGIIGAADQCPKKPETRNGFQDDDGCPDEMPEAIQRFTGVIQGINFRQGTAEIEESSFATLDSAVEILAEQTSVRLEVSGHTSSEGTQARNDELSLERAGAVRSYFIEKSIDADRVVARGAGSTEPVADNATKEGREKNRRIEFRVLSQP